MSSDPRDPNYLRPMSGALRNALAPEPALNALSDFSRSAIENALSIAARHQPRPALGLLSPFAEPEVAESQRARVAWENLTGSWETTWADTQEGRRIYRDDHGNRNSVFGWEIGRLHPGCYGGRYTRSNIIAQHWRDNASEGGSLSALAR